RPTVACRTTQLTCFLHRPADALLHHSFPTRRSSDLVWLNNPRLYHEASGTSGMTAAMNATLNLSIPDGWIPEFAQHGENSFIIETAPAGVTPELADKIETNNLYDLLENEVIPTYYDNTSIWWKMVRTSMTDIVPQFDSGRMAREYYEKLYCAQMNAEPAKAK